MNREIGPQESKANNPSDAVKKTRISTRTRAKVHYKGTKKKVGENSRRKSEPTQRMCGGKEKRSLNRSLLADDSAQKPIRNRSPPSIGGRKTTIERSWNGGTAAWLISKSQRCAGKGRSPTLHDERNDLGTVTTYSKGRGKERTGRRLW